MGWRKRMKRAKRLHRPSLKDWECDGLVHSFPEYVQSLECPTEQYRAFLLNVSKNKTNKQDAKAKQDEDGTAETESSSSSSGSSSSSEESKPQDITMTVQQEHIIDEPSPLPTDEGFEDPPIPLTRNIPVVLDARTLSVAEFTATYERLRLPCVIQNIPAGHDGGGGDGVPASPRWSARERWNLQWLSKHNPVLGERRFKCGEDDDGCNIKVKLKHFLSYMAENSDDSPLYVFDSGFDDDKYAKVLLKHYKVPSYFKNDLFGLVSERRRPPYRWWLVGPQRSGTCVHIDPLATSAWNTLIEGKKRWVLFPPHVPKHVVKGKGLIGDDEDDEAIHYFMFILPRIKAKAVRLRHTIDYRQFCCFEFTQHAGETVYIPTGWWHAVLNLTDTCGITQNFCSIAHFDRVWIQTRQGRKRMAWKWLLALETSYPELALRAKYLNARDGFCMKYDPAVRGAGCGCRRRRDDDDDAEEEEESETEQQQQQSRDHEDDSECCSDNSEHHPTTTTTTTDEQRRSSSSDVEERSMERQRSSDSLENKRKLQQL